MRLVIERQFFGFLNNLFKFWFFYLQFVTSTFSAVPPTTTMQEAILSNFCDTVSLYEEVTPIIEVKIVANGRAVSIVLFLYGFLNSEKILTLLLTSFNSMAGVKRNRLQIGYLTQTVREVIKSAVLIVYFVSGM